MLVGMNNVIWINNMDTVKKRVMDINVVCLQSRKTSMISSQFVAMKSDYSMLPPLISTPRLFFSLSFPTQFSLLLHPSQNMCMKSQLHK